MHIDVVSGDILRLYVELMLRIADKKENAIPAHNTNTVVTMPTQTKHSVYTRHAKPSLYVTQVHMDVKIQHVQTSHLFFKAICCTSYTAIERYKNIKFFYQPFFKL